MSKTRQWEVIHGDCLDVMRGMTDASVDAVVSDPPYGLSFMGKSWDHGVPGVPFWAEALRVAKPGAHLLAFGGTRTFHRLAVAIEDAGWEVRDCFSWLYGTGFPKSHNLDGAWDGWGTALKPAWEPIIVARKPLVGTVARNVGEFGTGALNIDGCRIGTGEGKGVWPVTGRTGHATLSDSIRPVETNRAVGRWPANVILDEDAAAALDAQTGERGASAPASGPSLRGANTSVARGKFAGLPEGVAPAFHADSGGASRFFYVAKASRSEREAGLREAGLREAGLTVREAGGAQHTAGVRMAANHHPTVKPVAVMAWLCRLVTPPNGIVLDPFTGSGTTGVAAIREGFRFIGIEREAQYVEIARARIANEADPKGQASLL